MREKYGLKPQYYGLYEITEKMNYMLQEHGAKHVLKIPNGLNELCSDISREVR